MLFLCHTERTLVKATGECGMKAGMVWPFSRKRTPPAESREMSISFTNRMVRVANTPSQLRGERTRRFFGPFRRSPNGEYLLAWQDADPAGNGGGFRESGEGEFLLFRDNELLAEGRLERPEDGHVADNGIFILSDVRFGEDLRSTFCAFDSQGQAMLKREFGANALNSGLSQDGCFAAFMTANSDNDDANKLTLFDLDSRNALWSKRPESGIPNLDGPTSRLSRSRSNHFDTKGSGR